MEDKTLITLWVLTLISLLEITALLTGLDGAIFLPVVAVLSGLGGHVVTKEWYCR